MPEQQFIPKFKTGETCITKNHNVECIIVSTYNRIYKYSSYYRCQSIYDDTRDDKTLYLGFCLPKENFFWYLESDLEPNVYCSNIDRGKKILIGHKERINVISEIPPEEEDWDDFYYDSEELL